MGLKKGECQLYQGADDQGEDDLDDEHNNDDDEPNNNDEFIKTKISLGNRSIWDSINLNITQDFIYPTKLEPVEYLTNINGRFKLLKLKRKK